MAAVMVDIAPIPATVPEDRDAVVLVEDVEALTADTLPGCGDDNPYN